MSYLLIHTLPSSIRDSQRTDARVMARTETMPRQLMQDIMNGVGLERPAVSSEPLFCYSVLRSRGEDMHVLSSVRGTETDGVLIAHHLVLRGGEKDRAAQRDSRATPAGIALLLELQHFWETNRQGEPVLLPEEEVQLPGACPATGACATWQVLSGNAENAKILLREPYKQGCVIGVPPGARVRDALRLLHESDALSPQLGWGNDFAVYCAGQRLPTARQRIVCAADSPVLTLARQAGIATLRVLPGLSVQAQSAAPDTAPREEREQAHAKPAPQETSPVSGPETASVPVVASLRNCPEYHFVECPPTGFFAPSGKELKRRRVWARGMYILAAGLLLLAVTVLLRVLRERHDDAAPMKSPPGQEPPRLAVNRETSPLPSLPLDEEEPSVVPNATGVGEQRVPPAPTQGNSPVPPTDAPDTPNTPGGGEPPVPAPQPSTPDDASVTASQTGGGQTDTPGSGKGNAGIESHPGVPQVICAGGVLPPVLLPEDSAELERGEYVLNYRSGGQGDGGYTRLSIPLQPGKTVLRLRRSAPDTVCATVMNGSAPMPGIPVLNYTVRVSGQLSVVEAQGQSAAAQLPYPDSDGNFKHVLLVSKPPVRLRTVGYKEPPLPAERLKVRNLDTYIETEGNTLVLQWQGKPTEEWAKMLVNQTGQLLLTASLDLPDFGYKNELEMASTRSAPKLTAVDKGDHYEWAVTRRFQFSSAVNSKLSKLADAAPKTRNRRSESLTPARLYTLLRQLNARTPSGRREQLVDDYLRFFKNVENIRYAREDLLSDCPDLVPVSDGINAKQRERLLRPESGERLLQAFRNCLTRHIRQAYETRRQEIMNDLPAFDLVLVEVTLRDNKLIWKFKLRPSS